MSVQDAVRYRVDPGIGRFTVKAFASGLLAAMGHNPAIAIRDYSGEAGFATDTLDRAFLRMTVRPESFEVTDEVSDKDKLEIESRMKREALETAQYPTISFESSNIAVSKVGENSYAVKVSGTLSLHGIACPQTIQAQVALNGDSLRAYGEFSLRQTDFGIKLVSVAAGALKVKDELKVSFDITARKLA
jgi:polyisoprenoid-binding protein YceI